MILIGATCKNKQQGGAENKVLSVAFYNIDNLYDDVDDADHDDQDFTPNGQYQWTVERYHQKLNNLAVVISKMIEGNVPDVLGVCELESEKALQDLIQTDKLKNIYGTVHYDSPDERGVDVALLFNKEKLQIIASEKVTVVLSKNLTDRTRDQLFVKALLKSTRDTLFFYVCHFPSRREGKDESEINRMDAARTCKNFINSHINLTKQNLIIMGDFNDEPWDKSIHEILKAENIKKDNKADLQNLMWNFKSEGRGSYKFKNELNTLDQLIISKCLNDGTGLEYTVNSANIFDAEWLTQTGKYAGFPLRTFGGNKWLNGYSDHYPIYLILNNKNVKN